MADLDYKEKRFLTACMAQHITDYLNALEIKIKTKKREPSKNETISIGYGKAAEAWIFEGLSDPEFPAFSFDFICSYLGLDPDRFRKRLKELKKKELKELRELRSNK